MNNKFKFILSAFFITHCFVLSAIEIQKVEPPFWWIGMQHTELQLLIYGDNIASSEAFIDYPGVELLETSKVENPNYLFLTISFDETAKPGFLKIAFRNDAR